VGSGTFDVDGVFDTPPSGERNTLPPGVDLIGGGSPRLKNPPGTCDGTTVLGEFPFGEDTGEVDAGFAGGVGIGVPAGVETGVEASGVFVVTILR
jgi:hypothetical protein